MADRPGFWHFVRGQRGRAEELTPAELGDRPLRRGWVAWRGWALLALLELNSRAIERWGPPTNARRSPNTFPWAKTVEAAWPTMKDEVDSYLRSTVIPEIAEVAGFVADRDATRVSVPADSGAWRAVHLQWFGRWIPETTKHFPATMRALESVRGAASIGFTALDGHSHIAEHVGPNRGALRYQLPILVPGSPGSSRMRVLDEMILWREGESVVFDLAVPHEVWNDSDQTRVLLMIEAPTPMPAPLSFLNRFTQWCTRYYPPNYRQAERASELARRSHDRVPA